MTCYNILRFCSATWCIVVSCGSSSLGEDSTEPLIRRDLVYAQVDDVSLKLDVTADDPPLLMFHGSADQTVLLDQSQRMLGLYQGAGVDVRLVVLDGAGHGGQPFFAGEHFETARRFLDQHRPRSAQNNH